jgi:hypothetical protein
LPIVIRSLSSDWRQFPVAVTTSICGLTPEAYGSSHTPTNQEESMFPRRTVICALVCALLTCAVSVAPAAASQPDPQAVYYASYDKHDAADAFTPSRFKAAAQARYYASYGQPQPLTPAHQPAPADDGTPWLEIAVIVAAALAVAATGATVAVRMRRRVPRVAA